MKDNQFPEENDFLEEEEYLDEELPEEEYPEEELPQDEFFEEAPVGEEFPEEYADEDDVEDAPLADDAYIPEDAFEGEEVLHDQLVYPDTGDELTAADHAMYEAGLTHPEDAEFMEEVDEEVLPAEEEATDDTPEEQTQLGRRERPAHKGRPRRRKGYGLLGIPQILSAAIWLLIILAIGVSLGRMIWVCAADVLAFGRESKEVTISITTDDTMDSIADKLEENGLIRYKDLFLLYADLTDAEDEITTGTFTLNTIYDYMALVNHMSPRSSSRAVIEDVLIPEGYSCRQIFERLEEKGVCSVKDLEEWAATGELGDYWFLEGVERGDKYCLEGFLFPATYDFYENSTPKQVLIKMLNAFEANFTEELQAQIVVLNEHLAEKMRANGESEEYIVAHTFTVREVVTVASLIEKETSGTDESSKIASVIYNRLFSWGNTPRYLNIDASIIYALDGKTDLTAEDMAVDSPYNTYTNTGLTPGPIANPGVASLKAALNPEETSYYYYVLDPEEGSHIFAKTYEEHQKNIESLG